MKYFMKTKINASEREITHSLIEYLNYQGFYVWRENTGAMQIPNKDGSIRHVHFGKAGMADIIGLRRQDGRFIAVEVKRPETVKRVTPSQESFLQMIREFGGMGIVATSIEDLEEKIKSLK